MQLGGSLSILGYLILSEAKVLGYLMGREMSMSACILGDNSGFEFDTEWTPACVHSTDPLLGA